ncbi:MAG: methyltransferase [Chitinophagaceae bacterium]|nr:methyltransferase [Chitinophagaceae bacterium]
MKVTTDACLFGALLPVLPLHPNARVLDVGTGTGLLSLMFAQKNANATIEAIEIEPTSALEAVENVARSPWKHQIKVLEADARHFLPDCGYNFIFSNPPFYQNQLQSPQAGRQRAHHEAELTLDVLVKKIAAWLKPDGSAMVLLPYYRKAEFEQMVSLSGYKIYQVWNVRSFAHQPPFRCIVHWGQKARLTLENDLVIYQSPNVYTPETATLLGPYYLRLPD